MSETNKMNKNDNAGRLIQKIFKEKWDERFLFDGLHSKELSYKEFFILVVNYKEKLVKAGLKKQDIVFILLQNSMELIILYFASLLMNLRVVPIDPERGVSDINEILSQLDYKAVIVNELNFDFLQNKIHINEFINIQPEDIEKKDLILFDDVDFDSTYLIVFTSGSTGVPKGVMHSFNNLIQSAVSFNDKFAFTSQNIFYHNLPMTYMAGILNLLILPFISGSKIVLGKRFNVSNISEFWNIPIQYSANTFWFIPTIIELLLKLDRDSVGSQYAKTRKITGCVGTAPLIPTSKIEFEQKYSISLYESYGLSETLFVTTNSPNSEKSGTVGKAIVGSEIKFIEDDEIMIKVPWMFLGYHNMKTDQLLKNGWFSSGDIGIISNDGFYTITGRKKDLIIRGGINISPKKIEDYIKTRHSTEVAVLGFPDKFIDEKIICFFLPSSEFDQKLINKEILHELGRNYHIDEFVEIPEIPKNLNGKVDKPKIREVYGLKINATRH